MDDGKIHITVGNVNDVKGGQASGQLRVEKKGGGGWQRARGV